MSQAEKLRAIHFFGHVDGVSVREFLREIVDSCSVPADGEISDRTEIRNAALLQLEERGDRYALQFAVERTVNNKSFRRYYSDAELQNFDPASLAKEFRLGLATNVTGEHKFRLLRLLGEFGTRQDVEAALQFIDDPDPRVANAACDAMTRLSDPRLLPNGWY